MRGLAHIGVFAETADGRFTNTDVSEYMRSDVTPSLREMILFLNDDAVLRGWQQLPTVLQSGEPAFAAANGVAFFDYIAADPQRSATVGKAMVGIYGPEGPKIAVGYPFGRFNTFIDIGGGQGHIVAEILQQHPALKGALLDLPPTAEVARHFADPGHRDAFHDHPAPARRGSGVAVAGAGHLAHPSSRTRVCSRPLTASALLARPRRA
jgi:hypothetical protein